MIAAQQQCFPALPLERACQLLGVNRGSVYRLQAVTPAAPQLPALREAIEAVVLAQPAYGYRRVTEQLRREGWVVNHKAVLRQMRAAGWLCRQRYRWVRTTDSEHGLTVYPNLLAQAGWRRWTRVDEAWTADITHIRLPRGYCYLAALLDGFSRKIVGWEVAETLEARLVVTALERAVTARRTAPGWIHHSDQGCSMRAGNT